MSAVLLAILLPAPQSPPHAVDFARDVQPIFEASCVSCHGPKKRKAGLRLDSLEAVLEGSPGGKVVLPGDSKGSELWSRLTDPDPQERMPQKKPPLQAAEIDTIRRWIDEGARGSAASAATAAAPAADAAKRREDLRFFAAELPKRHGDSFHHLSKDAFESAVADLDRRLEGLSPDAFFCELDRIANRIGDAHTLVEFPADAARLPLGVARFGADYRVVRAAKGLEKALGARVLRVHDVPVARARELLLGLTPDEETPELREARAARFLSIGMLLHGLGIAPERGSVRFGLAGADGAPFDLDVRALAPGAEPEWVWACRELPLFRQRPKETFWSTSIPDRGTVYACFRGYDDVARGAQELLSRVDREKPGKVVVDLRQNGGGDFTLGLQHLVQPLRDREDVNRRGHLYVLVGPDTFSAAMSNAAHFHAQTEAVLVGETVGERPNSWQEGRKVELPNSHLVLHYSTRFYTFVEKGENVLRPDQEIAPTWEDFAAGRDPVLEWVLAQ